MSAIPTTVDCSDVPDDRLDRWLALGFDGPPSSEVPLDQSDAARLAEAKAAVPAAVAVALGGVEAGSQLGMGVYVSRHGEAVAETAVGWLGPGRPMTARSMIPWFCCMKPLYAIGFALLWEAGEFELRQPVSDVIPEFGSAGKETITFWHLLTHTAGLRPDPCYGVMWEPKERVLEAIFRAGMTEDCKPGEEAYYGQFWSWAVLSEAIERRVAMDHRQFLCNEVLRPLGIQDCLLTVDKEGWSRRGDDIGAIYDTESTKAPSRFIATEHPWQYGVFGPGIIGVGSAGALGRIGEVLLPHPPQPLLKPQTVAALTARHRVGYWDEHWSGYVSWGLGMIVDGWMFGARCSPYTFGHIGYNTTFFCVDPLHDIVVAGTANGLCGTRTSVARDHGITDGVFADLGIPRADRTSPQIIAVAPPDRSADAVTQARAEARYWSPSHAAGSGGMS